MSLIVYDSGKKFLLDYLTGVGGANLVGMLAKLYTNNIVPAHGDLLAAYTLASLAGYSNQALSGWVASTLDATFHAFSTSAQLSFGNTSGSPQSVYGYIVTDSGGTNLIYGERFSGAPVSIPSGLGLGLSITFTQQSEF